MQRKLAPHAAKVVLYEKSTGKQVERWPVDARELLRSGDYTTDPPGENAVTVDPASSAPGSPDAPVGDGAVVPPANQPENPADLVPGLQPQVEYSPGVPLVASTAETASTPKPVAIPQADAQPTQRSRNKSGA